MPWKHLSHILCSAVKRFVHHLLCSYRGLYFVSWNYSFKIIMTVLHSYIHKVVLDVCTTSIWRQHVITWNKQQHWSHTILGKYWLAKDAIWNFITYSRMVKHWSRVQVLPWCYCLHVIPIPMFECKHSTFHRRGVT